MKKILDFIIIFLLVFLIMQFINNDDKQENTKIIESSVTIKALTDSYTVPAWIKVEVENKTKEDINVDVCKDLKI